MHRPSIDNPLADAFLKAGAEAGYPATDDISGYRQEGFGLFDRTTFRGERWSTARAYLHPVRKRANLEVVTRALVERVSIEDRRATGVVYRDREGRQITATASREVILSAGAVGSPHILMLSGIGPRQELQDKGIEVVADLPGVGANLSDHPDFVLKYRCLQPVSLWPKTRPLGRVLAGLQWLATRKGIAASNHFDTVACVRSGPGVEYPDLQFTLSPIAVNDDTWAALPEHAFQIHMGLMRAHSRGRIALRSADPAIPPSILINYLQDPRDRDLMRKGIRLIRELVEQPAFAGLKGDEIFPGADAQTDEELDRHLTASTASQWHLTGTARMGSASDQGAVVDPAGRVHNIEGLRVADASIMPNVTNGNTNSPTIMIAEKLSDAILGKPPLPRIEAEVWQNPEHATRQR